MIVNNYNFFERLIHNFALSTTFIKEISFDVDQFFTKSSIASDDHVFIAGIARSGTTSILNALYESGIYASLTYNDMPFIMAPGLWRKFSNKKNSNLYINRAHGDGIKISKSSPEAFEEVFWSTFENNKTMIEDKFISFVGSILKINNKKKYLSKNNQNIRRLRLIRKIFPKSYIFVTFRQPLQQCYSLVNQHIRFIEEAKKDKFIGKYMELIGHREFGPDYHPLFNSHLKYKDPFDINHWLEQWLKCYKKTLNDKKICNLIFLSHSEICNNRIYRNNFFKLLGISKNYYKFIETKKNIQIDYDVSLLKECNFIYDLLCKNLNFNNKPLI